MFLLGDDIRETYKFVPVCYETMRSGIERKRQGSFGTSEVKLQSKRKRQKRQNVVDKYVDSSDVSDDGRHNDVGNDNVYEALQRRMRNEDCRKKKAM